MKHAAAQTLQRLSDLLDQVRQREGLKEKKLGIFYRKSKSFLHFHEDPAGTFADLTSGKTFDRYPVNTAKERKVLLAAIDRTLDPIQGAHWDNMEMIKYSFRRATVSDTAIIARHRVDMFRDMGQVPTGVLAVA